MEESGSHSMGKNLPMPFLRPKARATVPAQLGYLDLDYIFKNI